MPEFGGLQIEVRCVKCGRLPATDVTLYEMQNHFYICNLCRQEDEQRGKQIAWVGGMQTEAVMPSSSFQPPTMPISRVRTRPVVSNLPPESIFARLELSLDTPISKIRATIKQQSASWMKRPDSAEKKAMIVQLRTWMEKLQDEQAFEEEREKLRRLSRKEGSALSVGGRSVLTAEEFLQACEEMQEGWANGERYLRSGQLSQWILFQLRDRDLAMEVRNYQAQTDVSDFRALNGMLYCLVPSRPFRFYQREQWQHRDDVPFAETPQELATLCDIHWRLGENHLYEGLMVYWLEHTCGLKGLSDYYANSIAGYADKGPDRGVGLELLLERAVPSLTKPQLEVTFDEQVGSCSIEHWDREIPHCPIVVKITNTTRGYTSLQMELLPVEPHWIALNADSQSFSGRPSAGMPLSRKLILTNLAQLAPGRKYQCALKISLHGEYGQPSAVQTFPVVLKTMHFFQGLRGKLWMWGLRGGIPGLCWNFAVGVLLSSLLFLLISAVIPRSYFNWPSQISSQVSLSVVWQAIMAGLVNALRFSNLIPDYRLPFLLVAAIILGIVGFCVGFGKGHSSYTEKQHASGFRKGVFWFSVLYVMLLLYQDKGYSAISAVFQNNGGNFLYSYSLGVNALQYGLGAVIAGLCIWIIACIVAAIQYHFERYLRNRYRALLDPPGRQ